MHAGIRQTLALFSDIEIPSGTPVWQPGDDFVQVVQTAQDDSRLVSGAPDHVTEHFGIASQNLK